jgi:uncharacterized damage-inducible protein DinB
MKETERIADQVKRAFEAEAWHGPSVMETLQGITAQQAAARPFGPAHSIWEIALHILAWERGCLRRLTGDRAELSDAEDWPAVTKTDEQAWEQTRKELLQAGEELRSAILLLDDSKLDTAIVNGMSTVYVTLHGVVQHSLYHTGQIAILKKALSEGERV